VRDGGAWKEATEMWLKDGGVWKLVHENTVSVVIASDVDGWVLTEEGIEIIDPIFLEITVKAGATVKGRAGRQYSLDLAGLNSSSTVKLVVEAGGAIIGRGGAGGAANGSVGAAGQSAIYTRNAITIENYGTIAGGGGGGGAGGRGSTSSSYDCNCSTNGEGETVCETCTATTYHQGGGGGGGAGSPGGAGGTGKVAGFPGTTSGGTGGAGGTNAGVGGDGGAYGVTGSAGSNGNSTNGGAGGASGNWIDGSSYISSQSGDGDTFGPAVN